MDGSAHGVQGLVEAVVQGGEVVDDARRVPVDDLEGLDLQQETGEEVADAVVDLAGDPGALGQGGGAQLVVLGLKQPGIRVLQGEDLLAQIARARAMTGAPGTRLAMRATKGIQPIAATIRAWRVPSAPRRARP